MKSTLQIARALAFVSILTADIALAVEGQRIMLKPELRSASEDRRLLVSVAFGGLAARTNPTVLGGMLGEGLIKELAEGNAQSKADSRLAPISKALGDYDFKGKALEASLAVTRDAVRLSVSKSKYVDVGGVDGYRAEAATDSQSGFVLVDYNFWMEPRLDAIKVRAVLQLMPSQGSTTGAASRRKNKGGAPVYYQQFYCFVPVKGFGPDRLANADLWSANDGEQIRRALDLALIKLSSLMARGFEFTEIQDAQVKKQKAMRVGYSPRTVENYYGKPIEKDETGTLIQTQFGEWVYYFFPTQGG